MKSFFMYSRLVLKHPGELPGSTREAIVEKAGKVGEVIGGAYESSAEFLKRVEFFKTSKNALQALRDGYNRNANPLEKYPSETERNKQLIDYVAKHIGCPTRDLKDALYSKFSPDVNDARKNKRHEITQRLIVLQTLIPKMQLTFVGATTTEVRNLEDHDAAWYMAKKNTFNEMLEMHVGPLDVELYLNKHLSEIREFANSSNPMMVAKKYQQLFFGSIPLKGQPGKYEINGHNLLDIATAYEKAREYSNLLHRSPDVRKSSLGVPPPQYYDLYVFETPQAREFGVSMKYQKIGDGQVDASGISDEPASRRGEGGSSGAGKSPERVERLDPVGDLRKEALKLGYKDLILWRPVGEYNPTEIMKYSGNVINALRAIANNPELKKILPEVRIALNPQGLINTASSLLEWPPEGPLKTGFHESWHNVVAVDYDDSSNKMTEYLAAGIRDYMLYRNSNTGRGITPKPAPAPAPAPKPTPSPDDGRESIDISDRRKVAADSLELIYGKSGYRISMLPARIRSQEYTYDYENLIRNSDAIHAALWDIYNKEDSDRKAILKKVGLSPTPERTMDYKIRREGYQTLPDGTKRILFKVTDNPTEMAVTISKGIDEIEENDANAAAKAAESDEKKSISDTKLAAKIKSSILSRDAWNSQTREQRESRNFSGTGKSLLEIAKTFGVTGDPATDNSSYDKLGDVIYGAKDKLTSIIKDSIPNGAKWKSKTPAERKDGNFSGTGKSLAEIAKTFGVAGDPATDNSSYDKLGDVIYGAKDKLTSIIKDSIPNGAKWKSKTPAERKDGNFSGTGKSLAEIAKTFGVAGDPATDNSSYDKLGDVIYGPKDTAEKPTDTPKAKVEKMFIVMSNNYGFPIQLNPDVTYEDDDYDEIYKQKNTFAKAFGDVTDANTKKILSRAGVILGEKGRFNDQEGVVELSNGQYRIAIDYDKEDAATITASLKKSAKEYESQFKSTFEAKDDVNSRLDALQTTYKIKGFDFASGFDDYEDLKKHLGDVEKAFFTLSSLDQKKLKKGDYRIVLSNAGTFQTEGWVSDHTILIDYREKPEDIRSDLSAGIEKQESKDSWWNKAKDAVNPFK